MPDFDSADGVEKNYLVSAVDPLGTRCVERVQATGAQAAIDKLAQLGFTEIQVETDDFLRALPEGGGADRRGLSPRDLVRIKKLSPLGNWLFTVWIVCRRMPALLGMAAFMLVARRAVGFPLHWIDAVFACILLLPFGIVMVSSTGVSRIFRQIQREYLRGHYTRVNELVTKFERVGKRNLSPEFISAVAVEWRARALAKQGKRSEALALVETLRTFHAINPVVYWHTKALVHSTIKEFELVLSCYKCASEIDPTNPLGWTGMIYPLSVHLGRPAEARLCLDRVRSLPMSPQLRESTRYGEGMILLAESRYAEARTEFEAYLPVVQAQRKKVPSSVGTEFMLRAQLAIACARTGDAAAARKHFKFAKPYLELHKMDKLLAWCKREVISN